MELRRTISKMVRAGITPRAWMACARVFLPKRRRSTHWPPRRIYVAFPYFSVGDAVLAIPLLERIRALWPEAEIDVAAGEPMSEIFAALPFLHRVDRMVRPKTPANPVLRDYVLAASLLRQFRRSAAAAVEYDFAIAPRWSDWDAFFSVYQAYLTGAPVRCGYSHKAYGGGPEVDLLLTHAAIGGTGEHESHRYTRLLARCGLEPEGVSEYEPAGGIPALKKIAEERVRAGNPFRTNAPQGYIVLAPGATSGCRMWPLERFAAVARWARQQGWVVVAVGSSGDAALCSALAAAGVESVAGETSALEMLDVIAGASLFVGNDSGPAHIAGAVGVPTVVVSPFPRSFQGEHRNAPSRFRPLGPRVRVLQPENLTLPCVNFCAMDMAHCILALPAEQAIAAAEELLDGRPVFHK